MIAAREGKHHLGRVQKTTTSRGRSTGTSSCSPGCLVTASSRSTRWIEQRPPPMEEATALTDWRSRRATSGTTVTPRSSSASPARPRLPGPQYSQIRRRRPSPTSPPLCSVRRSRMRPSLSTSTGGSRTEVYIGVPRFWRRSWWRPRLRPGSWCSSSSQARPIALARTRRPTPSKHRRRSTARHRRPARRLVW
jgi:hypothetical protein